MPVVHVYMYAGKTTQQKRDLVRRISKDFDEVAGVKPEALPYFISSHGQSGLGNAWSARFRSAVQGA